jgi:transposase
MAGAAVWESVTLAGRAECGFGRRKHWRGLATRYDKLATSYQATVDIVETLDWLRATPDRHP